jgi:peptidoglycan/LPS O-acetylase OafA/YrhL
VLIYHQTVMTGSSPLDEAFLTVTGFGWCGVDLFFVLSGFLITGILFDSKESSSYYRSFYGRRVLRIFPLYYAVVFLSLIILPLIPHQKTANFGRIEGDEPWYWLHLSNFAIARAGQWRHGILDVAWSLAIEEQFYLLWPLIVFLCSRAVLLRICAVLIATALLLRIWLLSCGVAPIAIYTVTPARMDSLAMGAWVALMARQPGGLSDLAKLARYMLPAAGAVVLALLLSGHTDSFDPLVQVAGYSSLGLLASAVLVTAISSSKGGVARFLAHPLLRSFGKYSYAMYLFHLPLRALIRDTVYGPEQFPTLEGSAIPGQLLFYLAATTLTYAIAWLSWNCFEVHFLRLKRLCPTSRTVWAEPSTQSSHERLGSRAATVGKKTAGVQVSVEAQGH